MLLARRILDHERLQSERNKNLFLLFALITHHLSYPLSQTGGLGALLFYVLFGGMFVLSVYMLSPNRRTHVIITITGVLVFIGGMLTSYEIVPPPLAQPILYLAVIVYHATMVRVLIRYIFERSGKVLTEVILAATSLYMVIGSMFTAIYALVEYLEPGSFNIASGGAANWQHFIYFSYVTLTTVGYGDITPVRFFAQSLATFEAITGVLYTVILLSRLVSLYEGRDRTETNQ